MSTRVEFGNLRMGKKLEQLLNEQALADNVDLVEGDVRETIPTYLSKNRQMSFAIVNIDPDLYEPIKVALEHLFPLIVCGGVVILDDYEGFPGAKKAADEYLAATNRSERIQKSSFAHTPSFLIKA
jgi:predicted O-methyltransferase YrrM